MENVFVYGTLKVGFRNHHWMERAGGIFISNTALYGARMFSLKHYPAISFPTNVSKDDFVYGELFSVGDLSVLDQLEGYPRFYNRKQVDTLSGTAWVYFLEEEKIRNLEHISSGVWE